jgi:hypothetical protein
LIHIGIHTIIWTRTCMHTHTHSYTPTNHETSQIFTNVHADVYASCVWICNGRHCCTHTVLLLRDAHTIILLC